MKCQKCGAKIKKGTIKCTYCGKELEKGKPVKKSTLSVLIIGIVLIVVSIAVLSVLKGRQLAENTLYTEHTIAMEEYFRAKDYENVYSYVLNNSIPYKGYEKYVQIYEICSLSHDISDNYNRLNKELESDKYNLESTRLLIQSVISRCLSGIDICNNYLTDYNELGNEDALRYFSYYFKSFLSKNLYFSDEDISEMCKLSNITSTTLEPFVDEAYTVLSNRS